MRKIAAAETFLTAEHQRMIREIAEKLGFAVDFYLDGACPIERAREYEILFGMCRPEELQYYTSLRWFCSSSAGVNTYLDDALYPNKDIRLSNSSGAFGLTIAEHLIMVTLILMRRISEFEEIVRKRGWRRILPMRSVYGSRFTVLGTGNIGTEFARRAKALGAAHITGIRRTEAEADPSFDEVLTLRELDRALPDTDVLVMALPATQETAGILSRERLALLPASAYVINVGRGSAIDQEALCEALNEQRLAGAALDVFVQEPLPQDSPLWTTKNLYITPHISGDVSLPSTCEAIIRLFCEDLENYAGGRPLDRSINRMIGY